MPYSGIGDADLPPAVKKLPKRLRELWVQVFNETFERHPEDEGAAFKAGWSAVRAAQKEKEQEMGKQRLRSFAELGAAVLAGDAGQVADPAALTAAPEGEVEKAMKTEGGEEFGASAYLVRPDPEKPSTWKLRVEESPGKVTVAQLGRAAAALGPGFRGQKVDLSDEEKRAAGKKLIALYRKEDVADDDIPPYLFGIAGESRQKEQGGGGAGEKALSLGDLSAAVMVAFEAAYRGAMCAQVFEDYLVALGVPDAIEFTEYREIFVVGTPVNPIEAKPPVYLKVPYTVERAPVDGTDQEVVTGVMFAPPAEWVRVVPVYAEFKAQRQADGRTRWTMVSSGGFEDRDGEVVSTDFLDSCVAQAEKSGHRGPLLVWHIPEARIGECDTQVVVGQPGFLVESGLFDDTADGKRAAAYYEEHAKEKGGSLKFLFARRTADGVYLPPGMIIERSVLPRERAAFPWSRLGLEEVKMAKTSKEALVELARVLGDERAKEIVGQLEEGAKGLQDLGLRWKEVQPERIEPAAEQPESGKEKAGQAEEVSTPAEELVTGLGPVPQEAVLLLEPEALATVAKQVADAMGEVLSSAVTAQIGELVTRLDTLHAAMKGMSADVEVLKRTDDERIAEKVANLPRATLRTLTRPTQAARQAVAEAETGDRESLQEHGKRALYGSS